MIIKLMRILRIGPTAPIEAPSASISDYLEPRKMRLDFSDGRIGLRSVRTHGKYAAKGFVTTLGEHQLHAPSSQKSEHNVDRQSLNFAVSPVCDTV